MWSPSGGGRFQLRTSRSTEHDTAEQPADEHAPTEAVVRRGRGWKAALADIARALYPEQRLAGLAALGLIASMFTPWWRDPVFGLSYWAVKRFTFIELALLLVAASVLLLLYRRGEGRVFHLPLSDGTLAAAAGLWCCFLVVFRMLDPPTRTIRGTTSDYHLRWGILLALASGALLALAGVRGRRRVHHGRPESVAADADATPTAPLGR